MDNKMNDDIKPQDPRCYHVKLKWISKETFTHLKQLLTQMPDWVMLIKGLSCNLFNLHALGKSYMCDVIVGQPISEVNTEYVLSSYRKHRKLIIANLSSKLSIITDPYRIALLISTITDEVDVIRHHLKLHEDGSFSCLQPSASRRSSPPRDSSSADILPVQSERERTQSLPKRPGPTPVLPTVEAAAQIDQSDIFSEKRDPHIKAYPQPKASYSNPLYSPQREEEIKYSVQASDDSPSADGYRSERTLPLTRNISEHAEIATNVPSVLRDIPGHRNTASGHQDTTRGASGGSGTPDHNYNRSSATVGYVSHINYSQNLQPQTNNQRRNSKSARHPEYAYHRDRLQSFSIYRWDEATRPSAEDLANSGLFATDRGDLVRCFQCGLGLKDWAKDDDPLVEHVKYSTDCDFLMQTLGIDKLFRFKDALNPATATEVTENNQQPAAARTSTLPYAVRSPRFMAMEDRMTSFINFPPTITQSHRELALAGLYYTGEDDICRCFTCDGGLKNWVPGDDPMEEHAKYFPQCPYLRHIKGDNFVELVRQRMQTVNVTTPSTSSGHIPVPRSVPTPAQAATPSVPAPAFRQAAQTSRLNQDVDEILRSPAGGSILQMGYSEEVVKRAIKQLISRGTKHPSAQQTMELILDYEENGETPSVDESSSVYHGASNETNADEDVLTENEHLKAMMKCIICKTRERNILCIPCSHHRMCQECARDVTSCPTCGKYIQQKVKTYMS